MSYISPSKVVVAPVTKKKLFLLDKTCEMQIFRPQIIIVLNFNQKTLLDKTCQVLCVLDSFYPSTTSTSVRADSSIPERYKFCDHSSADFSSSNYYAGLRGENHDTHDQTQYFFIFQEQERPRPFTKIVEMHPRRRTVVLIVVVRTYCSRCSFVFVRSAHYKIIRMRPASQI